MSETLWRGQLSEGLRAMELQLSTGQQETLLAFLALLNKWNRAYNLTAVREAQQMVPRQLLDSLTLLPYVTAARVLDVGAGGGLPGIPLAIARPDTCFTLLDSNSKKTRFLTQCKLELKLANVEVMHGRAEDCQPAQPFAQITSRAFTALPNLVDWCGPLLSDAGQFLAMKGQFPDDEVSGLPSGWQVSARHRLDYPGCDGERHLLLIDRTSPRQDSITGG